MMDIGEIFYPQQRSDWRTWLEANHTSKTEIWLQLYKKATAKPSLAYEDLVEECLCFGWIDGIVKNLMQKAECNASLPDATRTASYLN